MVVFLLRPGPGFGAGHVARHYQYGNRQGLESTPKIASITSSIIDVIR
jgi:hypothetical protein